MTVGLRHGVLAGAAAAGVLVLAWMWAHAIDSYVVVVLGSAFGRFIC